jgi:hypothetical protein
MKRRDFLFSSSALASAACLGALPSWSAQTAAAKTAAMRTRIIPSSGETVPVIGMGTSGSFEVPQGSNEYKALAEVLKRFFDGGAKIIDTAPTYSNAEDNLGPLLESLGLPRTR